MNERPAVKSVLDRLNSSGGYLPYYPALAEAFDSWSAAIVFALFMRRDAYRLSRGDAAFALTDKQGAEASHLSTYQFRSARDLICAPKLFVHSCEGQANVSRYAGNYEAIERWLTKCGIGIAKTDKPEYEKSQNRFVENSHPLKSFGTKYSDDDAARVRASKILALLAQEGVEGETRIQLAAQWLCFDDAASVIRWHFDRTIDELKAGRKIRSANGLAISRIRGEYATRTGQQQDYSEPDAVAFVREISKQVTR